MKHISSAAPAGAPAWLTAVVCCASLLLGGCDKKLPSDPPKPAAVSGTSSPVTGIAPADVDQAAASDRHGAPAVGGVEAGQAAGGQSANPPSATSGDGAASAAVR